MNAQKVIKLIKAVNPYGMKLKLGMREENKPLLDKIYSIANQIEPCDKQRNGKDRMLWLWIDKGSYKEYVENFEDSFTYKPLSKIFTVEKGRVDYVKMKKQWHIDFPSDTMWFKLYLAEHEGNRGVYINKNIVIDTKCNFDETQTIDMEPFLQWIIECERQCVDMIKDGTYTQYVEKSLPYINKSGVVKMSTYWKYVPDDKQRIFGGINQKELEEFKVWDVAEVEGWKKMSKSDYYNICDSLYDIIGLKEEYPVKKPDIGGADIETEDIKNADIKSEDIKRVNIKNADIKNEDIKSEDIKKADIKGSNITDYNMTAKNYYRAYAANYGTVTAFWKLPENSAEAFEEFVEHGFTEHHTWEVCLTPNIHLYPEKIDGKMYINVSLDSKIDYYETLLHICLELKKLGYPIVKPVEVEKKMSGEQLVAITPYNNNFDWNYSKKSGIYNLIDEQRKLPKAVVSELIEKIQWFPVGDWKYIGNRMLIDKVKKENLKSVKV